MGDHSGGVHPDCAVHIQSRSDGRGHRAQRRVGWASRLERTEDEVWKAAETGTKKCVGRVQPRNAVASLKYALLKSQTPLPLYPVTTKIDHCSSLPIVVAPALSCQYHRFSVSRILCCDTCAKNGDWQNNGCSTDACKPAINHITIELKPRRRVHNRRSWPFRFLYMLAPANALDHFLLCKERARSEKSTQIRGSKSKSELHSFPTHSLAPRAGSCPNTPKPPTLSA